jgi:hypothetical protein
MHLIWSENLFFSNVFDLKIKKIKEKEVKDPHGKRYFHDVGVRKKWDRMKFSTPIFRTHVESETWFPVWNTIP